MGTVAVAGLGGVVRCRGPRPGKTLTSSWASMTTLMAFSVNLSNMALVTTLPFLPLLGLVVALTAKEFPKKADEAFAFFTEEVALDLNGLVLDMTVVLVAHLLAAAHATDLFPCTDFIAALAFIFPFLTSRPTRYKIAARRVVAFLFSSATTDDRF